MRPIAKRFLTAGVLLLVVPVLLSGCIVHVEDIFHDNRPPRTATLHVYARDYFTGMPIPWAQVEVHERHWWSWNYLGTWPLNQAGYANVHCGYLYYDGYGGHEDSEFRVIVYAPGYATESYDIGLSYYYPSEMLTFYLAPYNAREAGSTGDDAGRKGPDVPDVGQPKGKVVVGEQEQAAGE